MCAYLYAFLTRCKNIFTKKDGVYHFWVLQVHVLKSPTNEPSGLEPSTFKMLVKNQNQRKSAQRSFEYYAVQELKNYKETMGSKMKRSRRKIPFFRNETG